MDYDPLPGPIPSHATRQWLDFMRGYGARPITVVQSDIDVRREYVLPSQPAQDKFRMLSIPMVIAEATEPLPYGDDFTPDGDCAWNELRARWRRDTPNDVLVDEGTALADHTHRCKPCRDRIRGLVQDIEGEIGASLRYDASAGEEQ